MLEEGLFDSWTEFEALVQHFFAEAVQVQAPEIWISDPDFSRWPLGQMAVVESLAQWARAPRKLTLLASDYAPLAQRHPRWVAWRRQWAHVVECKTPHASERLEVPTLLIAPGRVSIQRFPGVRCRGKVSRQDLDIQACSEEFDALLQRSVDSFPATVLGL
jgi:hypothetical protein